MDLFRKKSVEQILKQAAEGDLQSHGSLSKQLGVRDLTALGIAAIIGAGIFSTIGNASANGGPGVIFLFLFTAGLFLMGCRSTDCTMVYAHSPWEDAKGAKSYLNAYRNILVVCVYEDHWEDRGPHNYSMHHFRATVVRSYKGDWSSGEKIALIHGVDTPAIAAINGCAGLLMFVFTNEHAKTEVGVDTGDFGNYDPELERVLQCVFPEPVRR